MLQCKSALAGKPGRVPKHVSGLSRWSDDVLPDLKIGRLILTFALLDERGDRAHWKPSDDRRAFLHRKPINLLRFSVNRPADGQVAISRGLQHEATTLHT